MSNASGIKAGKAYVEMSVDDSALQSGLKAAQAKLKAFAASVKSIGLKMLGIGAAITAAFAPAIKAAADMETTIKRFDVAFGNNAKAVDAWADNYAKAVGRSKQSVMDLLTLTQNQGLALEFDPSAASKMSKILTTLALDWASFAGEADGEVLSAMQAALTGSTSAMNQYGLAVSDAAVAQKLLEDNINPDLASEQQKVMARLAVIMQLTAQAQGSAAKEAKGFHAVTRGLKDQMTNLAGAIGKAVLPVVTPFLKRMTELASIAQRLVERNAPLVKGFFELGKILTQAGAGLVAGAYAAQALAGALGVVGGAAALSLKALAAAGVGIALLLSPLGLLTVALVLVAKKFIDFRKVAGDSVDWIKDKFGELVERVSHVVGGMRDALVAGDLKLAAQILWLTLKSAWIKGIVELEKLWVDYGQGMATQAAQSFGSVAKSAISAWGEIKKAWFDARAWFDSFFRTLDIDASEVWNKMALGGKVAAIAIKKAFDWSFDSAEAAGKALAEYMAAQNKLNARRETRDSNKASLNASSQKVDGDTAAQQAAVDAIVKQTIDIITTDRSGSQGDNEAKLQQAMADLQKAIKEAADKRGALPVPETGNGATQFGQGDVDTLKGSARAAQVEAKTSVVGTFSSSVLGQMFGSVTLEQRTLNAAEKTARNTDDLVRLTREGGSGGILFGS